MARVPARPFVRMMMAMTVDGKIATVAREAARFGSEEDQRRLRQQVAWADALIVAAGTLRAYGTTFSVGRHDLLAARQARGQPPQPTSVIVTRSLDIPLDLPFFVRQQMPRIIATVGPKESEARERFAGLADVVAAGDEDVDAAALVGALSERGMTNLLCLGGGQLNWRFVAAGLVDEVHLTVAPLLFGGRTAPTVVDGTGFGLGEAGRLHLLSCEAVGDEVFLAYRVARSAARR